MVLRCPSCSTQLVDTAKFCLECGAMIGGSASTSSAKTTDGKLIQPLKDGAAASRTVILHCVFHVGEKVAGYCETCHDFCCLKCLTQKPGKHTGCGDVLPLETFVAMSDPFKDTKQHVANGQQSNKALMQKLKVDKADAVKVSQDELSTLHDLEKNAIKTLRDNFDTEVAKLQAAMEQQEEAIKEATKQYVKNIETSIRKVEADLQDSIDSLTAHLKDLATVEQTLASPFGEMTMSAHVQANKDASKLLAKTRISASPGVKIASTSPEDCEELLRLAELTVEVRAKAADKPTQKKAAAANDVPLTGPGSEKYFVEGARVARGPDWPDNKWNAHDSGGPGTVTGVLKHQGDLVVDVSWERTSVTGRYYVGVQGKYSLQLLHPPAQQ